MLPQANQPLYRMDDAASASDLELLDVNTSASPAPKRTSLQRLLVLVLTSVAAVAAVTGALRHSGFAGWQAPVTRSGGAAPATVGLAEKSPGPKRAVAFMGGGFLSLADFTGLVEGLLARLEIEGADPTLEALFENVSIISGISGGAWTTSLLVYSATFQDLTEAAAQTPDQAGQDFYNHVLAPLFTLLDFDIYSVSTAAHTFFKCVQEVASMSMPSTSRRLEESQWMSPWTTEALQALIVLLQQGYVSFEEFVQQLLYRGGGIDADMPLGTKHANRWAHGKTLITGAAALAPPGCNLFEGYAWQQDPPGDCNKLSNVTVALKGDTEVTYSAGPNSCSDVHGMIPTKFSVIVGGGEDQTSPLAFCEICDDYMIEYAVNGKPISTASEESLGDLYCKAFVEHAGYVSISGSASASSSFVGMEGVNMKLGASSECSTLTQWTTSHPKGESFKAARSLQVDFINGKINGDAIAQAGLNPLIDGGFVDNTGITHAVTAGAEEVLALLDRDAHVSNEMKYLNSLFKGTLYPGNLIFSSPTASEVESKASAFERIPCNGSCKFLRSVAHGTLHAVTADNAGFGITAGRDVTINVIAIETTNITIGYQDQEGGYSFDSFHNYGDLVGEIVRTLKGSTATRKILKFFS